MASAGTAYVDVEARVDELSSQIDAAVSAIDTQTIDVEAVADTSQAQAEIDGVEGGEVGLTVTADTEQAQEQVGGLTEQVGGLTDQLGEAANGGAMDSFIGSALGIGSASSLAATGGVAALAVGIGSMVSEAAEAEVVTNETNTIINGLGSSAVTTASHISDLSQRIMEYSGFSDESVASGANTLLMFDNINRASVFDRALEGAADLARKMNTDVPQAARMLGLALQDPERGLARLRRAQITLTDEQEAAVRQFVAVGDVASAQEVILDSLDSRIGDLAESYGDTLAGELDKSKQKLGENAEQIGGVVLPAVNVLLGGLSTLMDGAYDAGYALGWMLQGNSGRIKEYIQGVGTVVGELPPALRDTADAAGEAAAGADDFATSLQFLDDRTKAYLDGVYRVPDAERALRDAFGEVQTTLADPSATTDDLAASLEGVAIATGNLGTATGDMAGAVDTAQFGLLGLTGQGAAAEGQINDLNSVLESLPGQTSPEVDVPGAAEGYTQVDRLGDALMGLPPNRNTDVQLSGAQQARLEAESYKRVLDQIPKTIYTKMIADTMVPKARGGPVSRGEAYLVGEEGPEMFVPRQSGAIIPAPQTASMMAGGVTIQNLNVSAPAGANAHEFAMAVRDELRALERAGR